jgi:Rrf2 family protein
MIFTTKAEYGVRFLIQLGMAAGDAGGAGGPVSLKAIAESENLPLAYLERIAALLKKAELVASTRGAHGGYELARPAEDITMDQVVLALEGAVAPMDCFVEDRGDGRVQCSHHGPTPTPAPRSCSGPACSSASVRSLQRTTLAELVAFTRSPVSV